MMWLTGVLLAVFLDRLVLDHARLQHRTHVLHGFLHTPMQ
jgi:hypothetical protein